MYLGRQKCVATIPARRAHRPGGRGHRQTDPGLTTNDRSGAPAQHLQIRGNAGALTTGIPTASVREQLATGSQQKRATCIRQAHRDPPGRGREMQVYTFARCITNHTACHATKERQQRTRTVPTRRRQPISLDNRHAEAHIWQCGVARVLHALPQR